MRSYPDGTIPFSRNAFSPAFLQRISERDEPPTAGEADMAGPWHVEEIPGAPSLHGLFSPGESHARGDRPYAVFAERWLALLATAVLPGTGRERAFHLSKEASPEGYALLSGAVVVGRLALFDESLVDALHVTDILLRSPAALADLLEAAGQVALERSGAILDSRV